MNAAIPALDTIAMAIRASRAEFNRLFLQVQLDLGKNPAQRQSFDAIGVAGDDALAFQAGLQYAQQQGWLGALIDAIIESGLENGSLAKAAANADPDLAQAIRGLELQAITNPQAGFPQPDQWSRGLACGMRWTVKILIDAAAAGTGILIGPNLVLTAWHVVRALYSVAGSDYAPAPGAAARLQVEFDNFLSFGGPDGAMRVNPPLRVNAHEHWSVAFSVCHPHELASRLPDDLGELENYWDYAVIRLANTPGLERRWAPLDTQAVVPKASADILLFQHPAGQPLKFRPGSIVAPQPGAQNDIPRLRFLHGANAVGGTSGGPCFDKTFALFGLHQGEWSQAAGAQTVVNRGIPLDGVLRHLFAQISELPAPDPSDCPIWKLGGSHLPEPVIGCDAFQKTIWRSALGHNLRIISIHGDEGSGKTFCLAVMDTMLPDAGHLKIGLDAGTISKLDAEQLAITICTTAGASAPAFEPPEALNSTTAAWLQSEVLGKTIERLQAVRNQRLVWLSIADLNKTDIQGNNASALLHLLYEQTANLPWLRIVLDGLRGDIPAKAQRLYERHRISQPTVDDFKAYLNRAIAALKLLPEKMTIDFAAISAIDDYSAALDEERAGAMVRLAASARRALKNYLQSVGEP